MGNYSNIHKPLPPPPPGQEWHHDEKTKEWRLIPKKQQPQVAAAIATEEPPLLVPAVPVTPPRAATTTTATDAAAVYVSESAEAEFAEEKTDIVVGLPTDDMAVTAGGGATGSGGGGGNGGGWCNASANSASHRSEDEWELLSATGRSSNCGSGSCSGGNGSGSINSRNNAVFVAKVGSVRSITTLECYEHSSPGQGFGTSLANVCVPFKIQRTNSNSTIDSNENNSSLGPSGKGVLGVDYVEHVILPTDTMQGICIAYKISSMRLRQANHFSGNSLVLAPKKLVIPLSKKALRSGFIRVQDTDAKEYKLYSFLVEFPDLGMTEAKA